MENKYIITSGINCYDGINNQIKNLRETLNIDRNPSITSMTDVMYPVLSTGIINSNTSNIVAGISAIQGTEGEKYFFTASSFKKGVLKKKTAGGRQKKFLS